MLFDFEAADEMVRIVGKLLLAVFFVLYTIGGLCSAVCGHFHFLQSLSFFEQFALSAAHVRLFVNHSLRPTTGPAGLCLWRAVASVSNPVTRPNVNLIEKNNSSSGDDVRNTHTHTQTAGRLLPGLPLT